MQLSTPWTNKYSRVRKQKSERGQALTEYVLLVVLTAGVSISLFSMFNGFIQNGFTRFNAVLESELRVGGTAEENLGMWGN